MWKSKNNIWNVIKLGEWVEDIFSILYFGKFCRENMALYLRKVAENNFGPL